MAKLNSGNQYDVIFPGAKVVDLLRRRGACSASTRRS